jgi:farnesyl diphosphate synthase
MTDATRHPCPPFHPGGLSPDTDFDTWQIAIRHTVEDHLGECLPKANAIPRPLHEAMRYSVLGGGKRVRALLVFAAGDLTDAPGNNRLAAATAVELIHAYSLIHDDLPAMDNDAMRRGRPSCHIAFGETTALLAGDALQSLAFESLAAPDLPFSGTRQVEALRLLARASGSLGMAGGQTIDLAATGQTLTQPALELMHAMKTGALIRAAILLGALCGEPLTQAWRGQGEPDERLDHFAKRAGLLFQVVDDILDGTASSATLGKTAGKDHAADKATYVSLLGLEGAKHYADELYEEAAAALAGFRQRAARLLALADFIRHRAF